MMKNFLVNSGVDSIEVEEQYTKYAEESRKDRYITITLFQLEKKFGKGKEAQKFIADLVKGAGGSKTRNQSYQTCSGLARPEGDASPSK